MSMCIDNIIKDIHLTSSFKVAQDTYSDEILFTSGKVSIAWHFHLKSVSLLSNYFSYPTYKMEQFMNSFIAGSIQQRII